jgi:hypothetical protein
VTPQLDGLKMEDFQLLSALFQFYLDLVLKAFIFALGIAGGVSAFVLGKDVSDERLAACGFPHSSAAGWGWRSFKQQNLTVPYRT